MLTLALLILTNAATYLVCRRRRAESGYLSVISKQLGYLERRFNEVANEQEQQLDQANAELKQAIGEAADRVIAKLSARTDVALSDEIAAVQEMRNAVIRIAADEPAAPAEPSA